MLHRREELYAISDSAFVCFNVSLDARNVFISQARVMPVFKRRLNCQRDQHTDYDQYEFADEFSLLFHVGVISTTVRPVTVPSM